MNQSNLNGQAKLFIESKGSILGYQINQNLEIESVKNLFGEKVDNLVKEGWVDIRSLESEINAIPSALNDPQNPSYLDSRMKISEDFSGSNFDWFMHKIQNFKDVSLVRPIDSPDPLTFLYNETGKQSSQWNYFRMSESEKGVLFDGYQKVAGVNLGGQALSSEWILLFLIDRNSLSITLNLCPYPRAKCMPWMRSQMD